jgi:hypothetical protein
VLAKNDVAASAKLATDNEILLIMEFPAEKIRPRLVVGRSLKKTDGVAPVVRSPST